MLLVFLYLSSTNLQWRKKKKKKIYEIHLPLDFPYISDIVFSVWCRSLFFLKRPSVEPAFGSPILQHCMKRGGATWRTPNQVHLCKQCKRLQFRAFRLLGFGFTIRSEWPDQKRTGLSQSIHTCYYSKCTSTCNSIALLLYPLYTVCKYTPTSLEQAKCFLQKERNSFIYEVCRINK